MVVLTMANSLIDKKFCETYYVIYDSKHRIKDTKQFLFT